MKSIILKAPELSDFPMLEAYKKAWIASSTNELMNGASGLERYENIEEWYQKIDWYRKASITELAEKNRIPQFTYLALLDCQIIGMVGIRPFITEAFVQSGIGHAGYSVIPSMRRQGLGTEILRQALEILKTFGVKRAIVGCYYDNIASRQVILHNGGYLFRDWMDENGKRNLNFEIILKEENNEIY